jgi:hypothetical protein
MSWLITELVIFSSSMWGTFLFLKAKRDTEAVIFPVHAEHLVTLIGVNHVEWYGGDAFLMDNAAQGHACKDCKNCEKEYKF